MLLLLYIFCSGRFRQGDHLPIRPFLACSPLKHDLIYDVGLVGDLEMMRSPCQTFDDPVGFLHESERCFSSGSC